jgi:hypothetical protein
LTELYKIWDQRRDEYRELNNSTVLTNVVDLDPVSDPGFDEQKLEKCGWKKIFFWSKIAVYLSQASLKDAQATGKAFIPQMRTSSTSKNEIYVLTFLCCVIFALLEPDPIQNRIHSTGTNKAQ